LAHAFRTPHTCFSRCAGHEVVVRAPPDAVGAGRCGVAGTQCGLGGAAWGARTRYGGRGAGCRRGGGRDGQTSAPGRTAFAGGRGLVGSSWAGVSSLLVGERVDLGGQRGNGLVEVVDVAVAARAATVVVVRVGPVAAGLAQVAL